MANSTYETREEHALIAELLQRVHLQQIIHHTESIINSTPSVWARASRTYHLRVCIGDHVVEIVRCLGRVFQPG